MYHTWKRTELSPANIQLDPYNFRLFRTQREKDQPSLVHSLVTHFDVKELAKEIVETGYFPNEVVIVTRDESVSKTQYVVLEGNRRVCACKLLLASGKAKEAKDKKFFERLGDSNPSVRVTYEKIPVVVAPDRNSARVIIARRHTRSGVHKWKPYMQGHFYLEELEAGISISEIARENGVKKGAVSRNILTFVLTEIIYNLPWEEGELPENPEDLSVGPIFRLFAFKEVRDKLGNLRFTEDGNLKANIDESEFILFLKDLVRHANLYRDGNNKLLLTSRTINTNDEAVKYLDDFSGYTPEAKNGGYFDAREYAAKRIEYLSDHSEEVDGTKKHPNSDRASGSKQPGTRKPSDSTLIPKNVVCGFENRKIEKLIAEAQRIQWAKLPHTSAIILRAILEQLLRLKIYRKGYEDQLGARFKGAPSEITFDNLLTFVVENRTVIANDEIYRAFRADNERLKRSFKEIMNSAAHNPMHIVTKNEIEEIREKTLNIISYLLEE